LIPLVDGLPVWLLITKLEKKEEKEKENPAW
jgi:hypothetical protein